MGALPSCSVTFSQLRPSESNRALVPRTDLTTARDPTGAVQPASRAARKPRSAWIRRGRPGRRGPPTAARASASERRWNLQGEGPLSGRWKHDRVVEDLGGQLVRWSRHAVARAFDGLGAQMAEPAQAGGGQHHGVHLAAGGQPDPGVHVAADRHHLQRDARAAPPSRAAAWPGAESRCRSARRRAGRRAAGRSARRGCPPGSGTAVTSRSRLGAGRQVLQRVHGDVDLAGAAGPPGPRRRTPRCRRSGSRWRRSTSPVVVTPTNVGGDALGGQRGRPTRSTWARASGDVRAPRRSGAASRCH